MAERQASAARDYVYADSTPVQILKWTGLRTSITTGGTSARVALPTGAEIIELAAIEDCYIAFGDNTIDASTTIADNGSRLFIAGVQQVPVPIDPATGEPYTHIAAIQRATAGILQIEKVN